MKYSWLSGWIMSQLYKEIDPAMTIPVPNIDINVDVRDISNIDDEFERGTTEGFCDWLQRIVPVMMGKNIKGFGCTDGKNVRWQSFDDLLYRHKLTITNWPVGVPSPPLWVPHNATIDELIAVVGPYLKKHIPGLHTRHIVPNAGKRRFMKVKNKQRHLETPDVEVLVGRWLPEWCSWLENSDPRMFNIPLVTDTASQATCVLRQCRKFLQDVPRDVSIPPEAPSSHSSSPSLSSREHTPFVACKKAQDKQPRRDHVESLPGPRSKSSLNSRKHPRDEEGRFLGEHTGPKHARLDPQELHPQRAHQQLQSNAHVVKIPRHHVPPQNLVATRPGNFHQDAYQESRPVGQGSARYRSEVSRVYPRHEPPRRHVVGRSLQGMRHSRSPSYQRRTHVLRDVSPVAGPSRAQYVEVGSADEYEDLSDTARHYYDTYYD
ncbi:hypothetical protein JVU11DRAFT_1136 [Chiua virens]|nr:hypothetical protein JVU11DRAFT_1136 [Chiua virens]